MWGSYAQCLLSPITRGFWGPEEFPYLPPPVPITHGRALHFSPAHPRADADPGVGGCGQGHHAAATLAIQGSCLLEAQGGKLQFLAPWRLGRFRGDLKVGFGVPQSVAEAGPGCPASPTRPAGLTVLRLGADPRVPGPPPARIYPEPHGAQVSPQ